MIARARWWTYVLRSAAHWDQTRRTMARAYIRERWTHRGSKVES